MKEIKTMMKDQTQSLNVAYCFCCGKKMYYDLPENINDIMAEEYRETSGNNEAIVDPDDIRILCNSCYDFIKRRSEK